MEYSTSIYLENPSLNIHNRQVEWKFDIALMQTIG